MIKVTVEPLRYYPKFGHLVLKKLENPREGGDEMKIRVCGAVITVKDWAEMNTYQKLGAIKMAAMIELALFQFNTKKPVREFETGTNKIIRLPLSIPYPLPERKGEG